MGVYLCIYLTYTRARAQTEDDMMTCDAKEKEENPNADDNSQQVGCVDVVGCNKQVIQRSKIIKEGQAVVGENVYVCADDEAVAVRSSNSSITKTDR